jgi:hypothetical protein
MQQRSTDLDPHDDDDGRLRCEHRSQCRWRVAGPINAAKGATDAEDQRTQDLEEKISGTP